MADGSGVRVLVVDDTPDIRALLRFTLTRDGRFTVVGEAADGAEAIEAAARLQPDLVVLDRHMPVLDGVAALPGIRRSCPEAVILLFTAQADDATRQLALGSGADRVWSKLDLPLTEMADELARALLDRMSRTGDTVTLRLGPLPSAAARVWIPNTIRIIEAVGEHLDELGLDLPDGVTDLFLDYLREWQAVADAEDEFFWAASADAESARRLVECWAAIDALPEERITALGCRWSPPEGTPFFIALTQAVLDGLARHAALSDLAADLQGQWGNQATG
ncbi:MAG TPA: response regulator [Acidimicrobiales bacterium]|nr:response regulator [Acidimicrobiales bacterium]